jgi:hypothetical protein
LDLIGNGVAAHGPQLFDALFAGKISERSGDKRAAVALGDNAWAFIPKFDCIGCAGAIIACRAGSLG